MLLLVVFVTRIPSISEELAKEALIEYVASRCCYSSKPAKEMVFSDLHSLNTYRVGSGFGVWPCVTVLLYKQCMLCQTGE